MTIFNFLTFFYKSFLDFLNHPLVILFYLHINSKIFVKLSRRFLMIISFYYQYQWHAMKSSLMYS